MPLCLHCGVDNPDEARYCHNCGVELGFAHTPTPRPEAVVEGVVTPDDRAQRAGGSSGPLEPGGDPTQPDREDGEEI